jgi:hypothetical protein
MNANVAATAGASVGRKKSVRYTLTPRRGLTRSDAVKIAKKIRIGTPKTMIQTVFLTAVQKYGSFVGEGVVQADDDRVEREDEEPDHPGRHEQQDAHVIVTAPAPLSLRPRTRPDVRLRPRRRLCRGSDRESSYGPAACWRSVLVRSVAVWRPACTSVVLPVCHSAAN